MYHDYLKRKEKVIISAIDLLDEQGIQGLTTKELARREGITEPAIYKQFTGKQEILLAILDRYAAFDQLISNTVLEQSMSPKKAVYYYIEAYAGYYQSYPQITTVMFSFDVFRYETHTNQKMLGILEQRKSFLTKIILKGQEIGEFSREIPAEEFAEIILGILWSSTYHWKINQAEGDLKDRVLKALDLVITIS